MRLRTSLLALALAAATSLSACRWTKAPPLPEGTVESRAIEASSVPFTLGPGDRVSVQVFQQRDSSTPVEGVVLDHEGRLDLPLVGPVELSGLTIDQAREKLRVEIARYIRDPIVTFSVLQVGSRRIYLFGEVERPGVYPLDRPLNALQALTLGGSFRPGADREHVALLRGKRDALEVYFFNGATPGTDGMVAIQPDDFLFVRLSGAGTFRDQLLPIVETLVPPLSAMAALVLVADQLAE